MGGMPFFCKVVGRGTVKKGEATSSFDCHKLVLRQIYFRIQVKDQEVNSLKIMQLK